MENIQALESKVKDLPKEYQKAAAALVTEMNTPIEGIGDDPVPWKPGFLRLVQGTTDRGSIPKGAGIGDMVIGEEKLEQPLKFIPIRIWDSRQYWDPDQNNNRMLCWSPDAKLGMIGKECRTCPYAEWKEGEGAACNKNKTVLAISADLSRIFTLTFAKSNYKVGTELEGAMKKAGVSSYNRIYGLKTMTSPTVKNLEMFKLEVLDETARRTPAEILSFLKELFDMVSADRKATVEAFYKNVNAKIERLALEGKQEPLALAASAAAPDTQIAVEKSNEVSSMAKSYTL